MKSLLPFLGTALFSLMVVNPQYGEERDKIQAGMNQVENLATLAQRLYRPDNLMAWCVVPFDAKKRTPKERAEMLNRLGIKSLVYDYRAEHIPQWEEEIHQLKAHGIELRGWWFPTRLNDEGMRILHLIEKHQLRKCDLWVTGSSEPVENEEERITKELERLKPMAEQAARVGVRVGLYNHGGWFGKPQTLLKLVESLKREGFGNVGIVYNFHHAHGEFGELAQQWSKMLPYLIAVNLNGMDEKLGRLDRKIMPLGEGTIDLEILSYLAKSGYQGPIGILNHTQEDAEVRLKKNLEGLAKLVEQMSAPTPVSFQPEKAPLMPGRWPYWDHPVNRDRIFDYYTKQALHFKQRQPVPSLVNAAPDLDGGSYGHWGNQTEETWRDDRWGKKDLGYRFALPAMADGVTVAKAVAVRLGEAGELSAVFDPVTASFPLIRKNGFVHINDVRHGFMGGVTLGGEKVLSEQVQTISEDYHYQGYYRFPKHTVFAYKVGGVPYLDSAWAVQGAFEREKAEEVKHSLYRKIQAKDFPSQYRPWITLKGMEGKGQPLAVDRLPIPSDADPEILFFPAAFDFDEKGRAVVATLTGEVWLADGIDESLEAVRWKQIASGLHQPMGVKIHEGNIYVLGRDQITKLVDLNGDDEADFYECVTNAYRTSPGGHDYITGLELDREGYFYFASGTEGICRIKPGDKKEEILATGFRNPNQIGFSSLGEITVGLQEGDWVPASGVAYVQKGQHYGHRGAIEGKPISEPMVYLPRLEDNSSGGQTWIDSPKWAQWKGQWLHYAMGGGSMFLVHPQKVKDQVQAAATRLVGGFESGVQTGRFHPIDHELYVLGMNGWGTYTPKDGAFQRVRFTGGANLPSGVEVRENGVLVKFTEQLDKQFIEKINHHFAQVWNYRYSPAYGSAEYSVRYPHLPGHDVLAIESAHLLPDKKSVFLEISELPVCDVLHLQVQLGKEELRDFFITVHDFAPPFTEYPHYVRKPKTRFPSTQMEERALVQKSLPNPWANPLDGRLLEIEAELGLQFKPKLLQAKAGEKLRVRFSNPDLIPHNWVLLMPDSLEEVGQLSDRMISDADAFAKHYVPSSPKVLVYTDMVQAKKSFEISFEAPKQAGDYPYICTFPGHWRVMKGVLRVDP